MQRLKQAIPELASLPDYSDDPMIDFELWLFANTSVQHEVKLVPVADTATKQIVAFQRLNGARQLKAEATALAETTLDPDQSGVGTDQPFRNIETKA